MKRLTQVFACSLICAAASAGPVVNVNSNLYEIETVTGLLSTYRSTIVSQVWFGDSALARAIANEVGDQFRTPNIGLYGPMFGHYVYDGVGADYTTGWVYTPSSFNLALDNRAQENNASAGNYYTYAIGRFVGAAEVPEPSSISLLALGLFLLIGRKGLCGRVGGVPQRPTKLCSG